MFCGPTSSKTIEAIQERALRFVFSDFSSSYSQLLETACVNSLETTRIYFALIEVYKSLNNLSPMYMQTMFEKKDIPYDFLDNIKLIQPRFHTKTHGYYSFRYFGSKILNMLPPEIKNVASFINFKSEEKKQCYEHKIICLLKETVLCVHPDVSYLLFNLSDIFHNIG